jgi:hypothetical protein
LFVIEKLLWLKNKQGKSGTINFNNFLISYDLQPSLANPCVYVNKGLFKLITTIFGDDGLICNEKGTTHKDHIIDKMKEEFEVNTNNAYVYVGFHILKGDNIKNCGLGMFCISTRFPNVLVFKMPHQ